MEIVDYLLARKKAGGGSDVTIEQLTATENGTYSEEGIAYSPVVVNVPAPENSYQLTDIPSGTVSTIDDGTDLPMSSLKVGIEPVQDLHGYDYPWVGGAGKNKLENKLTTQTIDGVTATVKDDGTIVLTGTATQAINFFLNTYLNLQGSYTINGCPSGGSESTYYINVRINGSWGSKDYGNGITVNNVTITNFAITVANGYTFPSGGLTFKPMIRLATETDATFEPYSNICPISGWTAANVTKTGKNLTDDAIDGHYIDTDGTEKDLTSYRCTDYVNVNGITYLKVSISTTYPNFWVWRIASYDINKNFIELSLNRVIANGDFEEEVTLPSNAKYIRASAIINSTNWNIYDKTTFSTYTIQFKDGDNPLTVYGGTLDVTTGELTVTKKYIFFDGSNDEEWLLFTNPGFNLNQLYIYVSNVASSSGISGGNTLCDKFKTISIDDRNGNYNTCYGASGGICFNIKDFTVEMWKNWLTDNNVAVAYTLETPITYHLTPTQVRTLVGNNNIWADTGDIIEGKYFKEL